ncbi:non-canonical purine NTP pyrophosphatase [Rhizobium sp. CCGE 510]|uniref:non-canonical purine NTP pyrophosphatase n=1 Tax=Rhizobium sp. CCGE 510 TaxID=1132836 RepID=UPI00027B8BF2|nr:non-canonical purine NTP pyrophosphatase [Rhizobium sp. CCGE 510]EJT06506.1 Ham1-like protein [Rhizobium sp. CCGE 510]
MNRRTVYYATRSPFKEEELEIIANDTFDNGGTSYRIGDLVDFRVSATPTEEPLEIDLEAMVRHKARSAYKKILAPCIVEHAGLILDKNADAGFPGGLTQPMWDHLQPQGFLDRIGCGGERATARAVVGFCDGKQTYTFVGEAVGTLTKAPTDGRGFYWDVVFCPDEDPSGKTYAQIADERDGLRRKLLISQSTKAIKKFAAFLFNHNGNLFDLS